MKLTKYKEKRDLKTSPEPKATVKKKKSKDLIFVIQEHHASHLHWDLRLEAEGVLKSWAVPKQPPKTKGIKRLAIMVEDHPYSYKDFEGIIPAGYGKGSVAIWDKGTYTIDDTDSQETERLFLAGLKKGSVHFALQGKKLKGIYYLVRLKTEKKNEWLLFKK